MSPVSTPSISDTPHPSLSHEREFAESVAREAGAVLLGFFGTLLEVQTKVSATDPVSQADRDSEKLVADRIRSAFPGDAIIGEEGARDRGTSGRTWVIDPLDGTVNFLYDRPSFAVSIALVIDGATVVGVVFQPAADRMVVASNDQQTTVDGTSVRVRSSSSLADCLLATGFSYESVLRREQGVKLAEIVTRVRDIRRDGSAALDLASVAIGQSDVYYEQYVRPWDIAAGVCLVRQAGGAVRTWESAPGYLGVIAGQPDRVHELADLVGLV